MSCSCFLCRSLLQLMSNKGNTSLTNLAQSTVCNCRNSGWDSFGKCLHSQRLALMPLLPSLRLEAAVQGKRVTTVRLLGSQGPWHEDRVLVAGRNMFPDSIAWTSPRALFLTLDGNTKPKSKVLSTIKALHEGQTTCGTMMNS